MIDNFLEDKGWNIAGRLTLPGREGEYFPSGDLPLGRASLNFLSSSFPSGIYRHQKEVIKSFLEGGNVCITTGTASGKSLPFYVAGMEKLVADPKARVRSSFTPSKPWGGSRRNAGLPRSATPAEFR